MRAVGRIVSASLSINIASAIANGVDLSLSQSVGRCIGLSVWKVCCGKTSDWIRIPDAVWDGELVRSRDGCVRWGGDRRREGVVLGLIWGVPL